MLVMSRLCNATRWPAMRRSDAMAASPPIMREISVEVPPMSKGMRSPWLNRRAAYWLPATPPAGPESTQPQFKARQVALQSRTNIGVDHRRAEAIVLLDLGQDSRRERNICPRHRRTHSLCACLLVDRIPPAVQIADRNGFNTLVLQARNGRSKRVAVQRDVNPAIRANSLAHTDPALARHELYGRWQTQMVAIVLEAFPHLDDVAMAFCGQKANLGALALEKRIGGDRSAVDNPLGPSQHRGAVNCQDPCKAIEPFHDAQRLITWSRRN